MNPITSHRHGKGRFATYAWGPAEKCMECVAEKARDEARIQWAKEYQEEQEAKKVNALLQKDDRVSTALHYAAGKAISLGILSFAALMLAVPVLATPEDVERIWAFWRSLI